MMLEFPLPLSQLLNTAIQAALEGGSLLRQGFATTFGISSKSGRHDLVTDYDVMVEKLIISKLSRLFPDHSFLGEESGASSPRTDSDSDSDSDSVCWVIDPLDGTVNFARQIPFFAVSIAATYRGEILCGVVYNPMTHELFTAEKGGGAHLNGKKLAVSGPQTLAEALFGTGFPYNLKDNPQRCQERLQKILQIGSPLRRLGSAAMDLAYVAAGRIDAFWEVELHPWDVAAGVLLVQEAGGFVSLLEGGPFALNDPLSLVAGNETLVALLLKEFHL